MNDLLRDGSRHNPGGKVALRLKPGVRGGAAFHGPNGCYRTVLWREFSPAQGQCPPLKPYALWIGMNPSVAAAQIDDPTVNRETAYTRITLRLEGYRKANVADFRATNPDHLATAPVPACSAQNLPTILALAAQADRIIAAWGNVPRIIDRQAQATAAALVAAGHDLWCLGVTKAGNPRHPLYVAGKTDLQRWVPSAHGA